ncbi:hypothetical protein CO037_00140 [Candidatus Pacearchaeota archaeon CG_4_9_14_0_2_um_filter_30_8]|nr:MAG: hypothetical protein CO037_00140 [Candidatus Pacearchaeota archaeon CG_4_9_14_0_2_um_filter_30_8]
MKLEEITKWKEIIKFLEEKGFFHDEKNCDGSLHSHTCKNCEYYFELVDYQQEIARTKYSNLTPIQTCNKSFGDMKVYLQNKIKIK